MAGELARMEEDINTGAWEWDVKNDSGEKVASGVYIFVITDDEGRIKKSIRLPLSDSRDRRKL